ncbi:MAG: hypothetical protein C5B60_02755 [Chloroflexi bacterium]|nr:MAG: hypothetical protein C5B60_02755 [Chloroflexota bacterium]
MLALSLVWVLLGLSIGLLALGGRLRLNVTMRHGWALLLLIGALAGLAGGWLGTLVYGRFFGTATSAWLAVLAVVLIPWIINRRS